MKAIRRRPTAFSANIRFNLYPYFSSKLQRICSLHWKIPESKTIPVNVTWKRRKKFTCISVEELWWTFLEKRIIHSSQQSLNRLPELSCSVLYKISKMFASNWKELSKSKKHMHLILLLIYNKSIFHKLFIRRLQTNLLSKRFSSNNKLY